MRCENCGTAWSISIQGNSIQKYCPVCGKPIMQGNNVQLASLEETLLVIARDYGLCYLQDSSQALAYFSDLAPHLRKERIMLQHLIQCNGNRILIAALQESPAEQQLRLKQVASKLMNDLFVSESAANLICSGFWNAITVATAPKAKEPTPEELYQESRQLEKSDPQTALQLLTQAAQAGLFEAQANTGMGHGLPKIPRKHFIGIRRRQNQAFLKPSVIWVGVMQQALVVWKISICRQSVFRMLRKQEWLLPSTILQNALNQAGA